MDPRDPHRHVPMSKLDQCPRRIRDWNNGRVCPHCTIFMRRCTTVGDDINTQAKTGEAASYAAVEPRLMPATFVALSDRRPTVWHRQEAYPPADERHPSTKTWRRDPDGVNPRNPPGSLNLHPRFVVV
ncbi:hypothetical protein Zm00014a_026909 [Zea mays]|uniref:Uncharacterized protein n=2 Tax=Zea mays TaxID=4577 RepID=A0A8J8XLM4_MAIZE|nr:hypothetical protein ZEAMMB73_Zm00001d009483 [Zea mays]PWZ11796.1 hypothetical protein Zm00014a_026909 [Zea mays]